MRFLRKYTYYLNSFIKLLTGFKNPLLILRIFLGTKVPGPVTVCLRRTGIAFRVRGAMDVWSIKETFLDRFYERCGFSVQPGWMVIDVGAGLGDFSLFTARVAGTRVLAFEPFPESFSLLRENAEVNRAMNLAIFQEAVSYEEGTLSLDLAGGEPLQIQSRNAPVTKPDSQIGVKARSLAGILQHAGENGCDLLKLDCEGAEYDILMNSPADVLCKIQRIVMEYHDGVTQHSHADLAAFLRDRGYKVETFDNPVHAELGYLRAER